MRKQAKKPTSSYSKTQIGALIESVNELNNNLGKLSDRLFGDPDRQLKGLTQEVQDLAQTTEKALRETTEAISKLNSGMTAVDAWKHQQAELNEKFKETSEQVERSKNQLVGGWKTVLFISTAASGASGVIMFLLTKTAH